MPRTLANLICHNTFVGAQADRHNPTITQSPANSPQKGHRSQGCHDRCPGCASLCRPLPDMLQRKRAPTGASRISILLKLSGLHELSTLEKFLHLMKVRSVHQPVRHEMLSRRAPSPERTT